MQKCFRYIGLCFFILLILALLAVVSLPTVISTSWGRNTLITWVNRTIPGSLEIKTLNLNWSQGQSFEGLKLVDPEGKPVIAIDSFSTDSTLWQLVRSPFPRGTLSIKGLNATLVADNTGVTNLDKALSVGKSSTSSSFSPITLSHVNLEMSLEKTSGLYYLKALGETTQGNVAGSFNIDLHLPTIEKLKTAHATYGNFLSFAQNDETVLKASILNFPISLIDQLILMNHSKEAISLSSLLGESLSLTLQKVPSKDGLAVDITQSTPVINSQTHVLIRENANTIQLNTHQENEILNSEGRIIVDCESSSHLAKNLDTFFSEIKKNARLSISFIKVPFSLIPFLKEQKNLVTKIGSIFDGRLSLIPIPGDNYRASISLRTPQLVLEEAKFEIGKKIHLIEETQLTAHFDPDVLHTLLRKEELFLDGHYTLHLLLKSLELPLDNPRAIKGNLITSIPALQFPKLTSLGSIKFERFTLNIKADDISLFKTDLKGFFSILSDHSTVSPLLQEPLESSFEAVWELDKHNELFLKNGDIRLKNKITRAEAHLQGSPGGYLNITKPIEVEYLVTKEAAGLFNQSSDSHLPRLQDPFTAHITIDPSDIYLKDFSLSRLRLSGSAAAKKIAFTSVLGPLPTLEEISIPWTLDFPKSALSFSLKASVHETKEDKSSPLALSLKVGLPSSDEFDLTKSTFELRAGLRSTPTSFLALLFNGKDFKPLLGSVFDFNFKVFFDPTDRFPGYFDLVTDSENFHLRGRFKIDHNATIYESEKPPLFRLTLTPQGYQFLKSEVGYDDQRELKDPFTINGVFTQFDIPTNFSKGTRGNFKLELATTDIKWKHNQSLPLSILGELSSTNIYDDFTLNLEAKEKSHLSLKTRMADIFTPDKVIQPLDKITYEIQLSGSNMTPSFLRDLLPITEEQNEKLNALFGDTINLNIQANLQQQRGSVQFSMNGPHANFQGDGIIANGLLTLSKPLTGSMDMTPRLSNAFFSKNVPLLSSAVKGETPIVLKVEKEGFSCPLFPFKIDSIKIPKASLDLGKLHFLNTGDLRAILNMIHPVNDKNVIIWFTPIYMNLENGSLSLKRFDMLVAGTYNLANWGKINLVTHDSEFVLGLSAKTLEYAFGIAGLGDNYILQIPLKVHRGKLQLDQKKVTARISSLIAQTHGGTAGKLLGNVLDLVLSDKGEIYPSPTTTPFPWDEKHIQQ